MGRLETDLLWIQGAGLAFGGVESFHHRYRLGYNDKERRDSYIILGGLGRVGGQSFLGVRELAWPLHNKIS